MSEEIRVLKEILDNNDLDNYAIDDNECYLNSYARRCLKKVLEHYEILQEDNNNIRKALKTYEEGRYQEHLENEQLHSIIKEAREYIEKHKVMTQGHFDGKQWVYQYYELICEPKELLEILDKVEESK